MRSSPSSGLWLFQAGDHCTVIPCNPCVGDECVIEESEGPGNWHGLLQLGPFEEDVTSWNVLITFTDTVDWVETVMADVSGSGTSWSLASKDWDGGIPAGDSLGVRFIVGYSGNKVSSELG